ncbi:YjfB family protein [Oceanobacillus sp. CF4.6]|uniref:YjfB family protein n=1 Tax=Oceanobacillus sp. CF4.6 TaxID=3373080 RepID=UPI003EE653C2
MDIAALSVVMSNNQVRSSASLAVMDNIKDVAQQQSLQLMEMMHETVPEHPRLGNQIDIKL